MAERMTLCQYVDRDGAKTGMCLPMKKHSNNLEGRAQKNRAVYAARRCEILREYNFDVGNLEPQVAKRMRWIMYQELELWQVTPLDQVFIGSCTKRQI